MHGTAEDRAGHPSDMADRADFAAEFAAFAAGFSIDRLPLQAHAASRLNLLDTLACATAGRNAPGAREVLDLVRKWGGALQAAVWCGRDRIPAPHAAWINGVMGQPPGPNGDRPHRLGQVGRPHREAAPAPHRSRDRLRHRQRGGQNGGLRAWPGQAARQAVRTAGAVADFTQALVNHRDLGIHGGVISDGFVALMDSGAITNARKGIDVDVSVTGGLLGTRVLLDHADGNPAIAMRSSEHTHSQAVMARLHALHSINSALEIDITGQVNAEEVNGRYLGAVGGQPDLELLKRTVGAGMAGDLTHGLEVERQALTAVFGSADCAEGLAAFAEKRPARFLPRT